MLPTGYNILNGGVAADLSTIFVPLPEGGTMYETPTGFIQYSTGKDLRELFAVNTSYTIPYNTNWIAQNGQDLRYIFQGIEPPLLVTITGGTAPTPTIDGNKYTYTFTSGTRQISINKNVSLHVIVVGGGGGGGDGRSSGQGGGGAGGGFGYVSFSYVNNSIYNISVAAAVGQRTNGQNSTFINVTTGNGVTSVGGKSGGVNNPASGADPGNSFNTGIGTFVSRSGGSGASYSSSGGSSSGSITVLGVNYNYSGGGSSGRGTASSSSNKGGSAGANGVGGVGPASTSNGASASTPGSGGGGGAWFPSNGGTGGPGRVVVIFTYP